MTQEGDDSQPVMLGAHQRELVQAPDRKSNAAAPQAHGVAEEQVRDRAVQQQRGLRHQPVDARLQCLCALREELRRALPAVLQLARIQ